MSHTRLMAEYTNKLVIFWRKLLYLLPTRLPVGMTEFDEWAKSILTTYGWPDNDSFRFTLAAMVINLGQTVKRKPKAFFGAAIHSAASKQIAGEVFRELKEKQMAEAKKAAEAAKAEVTPPKLVASNEQPG